MVVLVPIVGRGSKWEGVAGVGSAEQPVSRGTQAERARESASRPALDGDPNQTENTTLLWAEGRVENALRWGVAGGVQGAKTGWGAAVVVQRHEEAVHTG